MDTRYAAATDLDIGKRERLEDACAVEYIQTAGGLTLQVGIACDGVGGNTAGEQASEIGVRIILYELKSSLETNIPELLKHAIKRAKVVVER
ncbi:MAG: hypothetical protein Phog2KO_47990 [Phototrophicaceae bacterium]